MANPFDQFDAPPANPFDQFNVPSQADTAATDPLAKTMPMQPMSAPLAQAIAGREAAGRSATAGLAGGMFDVYRSLVDQPAGWLSKHVYASPADDALNARNAATAQQLDQTQGDGIIPGAMRLTGNAVASAPFMLNPNLGSGYLATAAKGALQGAQAGAMTSAGNDSSLGQNMATGAAVGAVVPTVGKGVSDLFSYATGAGRTANPNVTALAQKASDLGVPIRPGQMSPSPFIKVADDQLSRMPMTGYGGEGGLKVAPDAQRQAFVRALSNTIGEDAPALTPDVMAGAKSRIGGTMDTIIGRNTVQLTPGLTQTLQDIAGKAGEALDEDSAPVTKKVSVIVKRMLDNNGQLSGEQYQQWRQRGGLLSGLTEHQNPTIAYYGQQIRNALDDAFQKQASATDGAMLAQARQQYRNLKVLEPLAEKAPTGQISPALVLGAVAKEYPDLAYGGGGDLATLGRIGQAFIKEPPNSTTAERSWVMKALANPIKAAGEAAGLPLTATIGRGMSSAINSPAYLSQLKGVPVSGITLGGNGGGLPLSLLSVPLIQRLLAASTSPSGPGAP